MKVVFIEDVPDVALAGETKEVADGYGRNYLLPKNLAVLANSAASNIVKARMKHVLVKRAQAEAEMKEIAGRIDGAEITIKARAGEKERLYGSVTAADIAGELSNIAGQVIDKRKIDLEEPIRQLGVYDVALKFTHDITAAVKVTVESEEPPAEAAEKEAKEEKKPRARKKKAEEEEAAPEEAEAAAEEPVAEVEEGEVQVEEAEAKMEEPEATEPAAEEPEAEVEEPEAKVEEPEAKVEEPEAEAEEPEAKAEKPKAKRKTKKKAEDKVEETESGE